MKPMLLCDVTFVSSQRTVYKLLLLTIVLLMLTACSLGSIAARKESDIAVDSKSRQETRPLSRSFPTSFEYVQLLDRNSWLVADFNHVWRTENGGIAWTISYRVKPDAGEGKHIEGLSFVDAKTGFLVVDRQLLRTDDRGLSWNIVGELAFGARSCHFIDSQHGWAVGTVWEEGKVNNPQGSTSTIGILTTLDGGKTWKQQRIELPQSQPGEGPRWNLNDVFFWDRMTGWAVGFGVILWTSDGGENWQVADAENGQYKRVKFLDAQFGWATQDQSEEVSVTTDGGRHWKLLGGLPSSGSRSTTAVFLTPKHGFATLLSLYETIDGGNSWKRISDNIEMDKPTYEYVGRALDGTLVALGLVGETAVSLVTTDNGATWRANNQAGFNQSSPSAIGDSPPPLSTIRKSEDDLLKLALRKVKPLYPAIAKSVNASGEVVVEVILDEEGNVTSARALSGHPLLRNAAVTAARDWKFKLDDKSLQVISKLTFQFDPPY